jgi:putative restriction endonuclease
MAYGVFIHRSDSIYDDSPAERYQFPSQYWDRAKACEGDWIVYYEPVKFESSRGYFAVARVERIVPDGSIPGMFVALIEPGSYLDFAAPVPFRRNGDLVEAGLLNEDGKISGRAQAAVRTLSPSDFNRILALGIADPDPLLPRTGSAAAGYGFEEEQAPFVFEHEHDRVSYLTSRAVRDRQFRRVVLRAYSERCALTGLKLINGGGRAEVDAAHIRPVEAHGPDIVTNGLALSGTAHWMFDRGLISLSNDLEILVSRQVNDPDAVWGFLNKSRRANLPNRPTDRPHGSFLEWHRTYCFKS